MRRSAISRLPRTITLLVAAAALSPVSSAVAATYQWDQNTGSTAGLGGTGAWDTTSLLWDLVGTGSDAGLDTTVAYTFTNADTAIFGGTAGTVTLGTGVTLNGLTFNTAGYTITGNTLTLAGTSPTITTNQNATISSLLAGAAGLTKRGAGMLTLNGSAVNTLTGGVTVGAGTLLLDYTNLGTPTNLISSANALTLAGGTLAIKGNATGTTSQTFNGLTLNAGGSAINLDSNSGAGTTLTLGAITRNTGATVNFTLPASGSITTTATNNATGILGSWASVGSGTSTNYATVSGGIIAAYTGATTAADATGLTDTTGLVNYNLSTATGTMPATVSANTIRYTGGAATTTLGATSFSVNGLMNAGTGLWTIGSNTLTIGANKELVVNTAAQDITISSIIANNSGGASSLVKTGSGILTLSGVNTYTGGTVIAGGTLKISADTGLGAAPGSATPGNITLNGGTLQLTAGMTVNANRGLQVGSAGGTILLSGATTYSGVITGSGPLTISGDVHYTTTAASPSYTGDVTLTGNIRFAPTQANSVGTGTITVVGNNTQTSGRGAQFFIGAITVANNFIISGFGGNAADGNQRGALRADGGTINGTITLAGDASIGAHLSTATINGKVTGGYALHINGTNGSSGTIVLNNAANSYTGGTSINAGTLSFSNGALGTIGNISFGGAATLQWNSGNTQDISGRLALGANNATFNTNGNDVTFANAIGSGGAGQITKAGSGTLTLTGYTNISGGGINASGGVLSVSAIADTGSTSQIGNWTSGGNPYLAVNGGTFRYTGAGAATTARNLWIDSGAGTIDVTNASASLTFTGTAGNLTNRVTKSGSGSLTIVDSITGTGGAVTVNAGTFNLTGISTYTGTTVINGGTLAFTGTAGALTGVSSTTITGGGTLKLDNSTASVADRFGAGTIAMSGGTIQYFHNGAASINYAETLGALTIADGLNTVNTSQAATGQTSKLTFASLARTGGTVNFTGTGLGAAVDTRNEIAFTTAPTLTAGGIIGAWATINGTDLATLSGNSLVAYTGYTDIDARGSTIAHDATKNYRIVADGTGANIALGATTTAMETLTMGNGTVAATIDTASKTLLTGGILVGAGKQALTIGAAAGDGFLQVNSAGGNLVLNNQSASNALTINAVIQNNTSASGLTKTGAGLVTLAGANSYTGVTTISEGVLAVSSLANGGSNSGIGSSAAAQSNLVLNNGTLRYTGGTVSSDRGFTIATGTTGTIDVATSGQTLTLSGGIAGTSGNFVKSGAGSLTLSGSSSHTGLTSVTSGTLRLAGGIGSNSGWYVGTGARLELAATNLIVGGHGSAVDNSKVFTVDGGTLVLDNYEARIGNITLSNGATLNSNRGVGSWDWLLANTTSGAATITVANSGGSTAASQMTGNGLHLQGVQNFNVADVTASTATDLTVSMVLADGGSSGGTGGVNKIGAGTMAVTTTATYTGGTTVQNGKLLLGSTGGGTGMIRGTVTVNANGVLDYSAANSFGWDSGVNVNVLNIVGGTVGNASMSLGNHFYQNFQLNMTGGTLYLGGSTNEFSNATITVNNSATTAQILGVGTTKLNLRDGTSATFSVADGSQAVDLLVTAPITAASANSNITKTGAGTMRVQASVSHTGTTTIEGGILELSTADTISTYGAGQININNGATLQFSKIGSSDRYDVNGATFNFGAAGGGTIAIGTGLNWVAQGNWIFKTNGGAKNTISGNSGMNLNNGGRGVTLDVTRGTDASSDLDIAIAVGNTDGGLTKTGTGIAKLTGANTYTGTTTINAGTLAVSGSGKLGATTAALTFGGGTLDLTSAAAQTVGAITVGSGNGTLAVSTNTANAGTARLTGGTLTKTGNLTVDVTGTNVSGNLGLYKLVAFTSATGSGTVSLAGNPDATNYALRQTATGIDLQHKATIGLSLGSYTANVHTGNTQSLGFTVSNTAPTNSADLSYTLGGSVSGTGTVAAGASSSGLSHSLTAVAGVNTVTVSAADAAASNATQSNAFTVYGYNLATGSVSSPTTINLGTVHAGGSLGTSAITVANSLSSGTYNETLGASFTGTTGDATSSGSVTGLYGSNNASMSVGLNSSTAGAKSGTATVSFTSQAVNSSGLGNTSRGTQEITVTGQVYSGDMTYSGGAGTWNTHANWTDNNASGVHYAAGTDAGYTGVDKATFNGTGGTVSLDGQSANLNTIAFSGANDYTVAQGSGGALTLSGTNAAITAAGTHSITAPVMLGAATSVSVTGASDSLTINGAIDGAFALTKNGSGNLTLGSANTFNGLTVNAGKVTAGNANALGNGTVSITGGELDLGGNAVTNTTISVTGGTVSGASGYTGQLNFGGAAGLNGTFAGIVDLGTDKTRAYSTTGLTVASTGTLQGQGTVTGNVTVNGHLNIGNSPGTLEVAGDVVLGSSSQSTFEIGGQTAGSFDVLSLSGTLTLDGTITVASYGSFNANTLTAGDSFDFIVGNIDGTGFNVATDLTFGTNMTLANGLQWDTSQFASTGVLSVTTAIPEPSTYGLLGAGALALATAVRRRRRTTR